MYTYQKDVSSEKDAIRPYDLWAEKEATLQKQAQKIYSLVPKILCIKDRIIEMEKIDGITIKQYLIKHFKNYKWCIDNIRYILRRFHNNNMIHGDTNLNNYLIDKKNQIWIIDFGMSRYTDNLNDHQRELNNVEKNIKQLVAMVIRGSYSYVPNNKDLKWFLQTFKMYPDQLLNRI